MSAPAPAPDNGGRWSERPEASSPVAMNTLRAIAQYVGRAPARLLLWPITLYFLLRRAPERHASRAYLGRIFARPARLREMARHLHCFAATILDRVLLLTRGLQRFDIRTFGLDQLNQTLELGRGVLLLGSHLGSFEVLRVLSLKRPDVQVRVVLDVAQNPALTRMLSSLNPAIAKTVIDAGQDPTAVVLAIKETLEANGVVTLLGDRARPGESTTPTPFLGSPAPFPNAPWLIANALKVPVALCFGLYRGGNRYDLYFEAFAERITIARSARQAALSELTQRYAQRLEHHARLAPYNWFNFYDFWQSDATAAGVPVAGDGLVRRA